MADIVKNIIFKITSQTAPGYLMDLKAGYDMFTQIASGVANVYNEMEEMIDVQQNLKIDISKVDSTVRGLVGTMNMMTAANRLSQAGLKVTAEQYASITKYAAGYADAVGIDSKQALDQLVSGLISGNERGLRPFGIALEDGTTKAQKQAEAIEEIGKKALEMTPKLDTSKEKWEAFKDSALSLGSSFLESHVAFTNLTTALTVGEAKARSWTDIFYDWANSIGATAKEADALAKSLAGVEKQQYKIKSSAVPETPMYTTRGNDIGAFAGGNYMTYTPEQSVFIQPSSYQPPKVEKKRGGGGRKEEAYKPIEAEKLATIGVIDADEQSLALEQNDKFLEQVKSQQLKATQDSLASTANVRELAYNYEVEQTRIKEEQILELQQRRYDIEADVMQTRKITQMEMALGVDQRYVNESARIWRSGLQGKMATMGVFFNAVSQLMTVKSKAMFQVGKAAAIAEGLVNTYLGAIKAYQSMCGLGPWGVALGIIAAAAVTAAGLANVNRIRAMEYGKDGGGGGSMGGSTSIGTGGGESALPSSQPGGGGYNGPPQQQEQKVVIEINMGDSALFLDAVVDQNDKASQTGRRYFARAR